MQNARRHKPVDPAFVCGHKDPAAVRKLLTKVGDKWSIFLILSLAKLLGNRARFSELEKTTPEISQRMLTLTLRNLERDGLITREVFPEIPPRVEYELTSLGKSLLRPMQGLVDWVAKNWEQVRKAQSRFDANRYSRERVAEAETVPRVQLKSWEQFGNNNRRKLS
jgi:DNA-binding HxlR family transcriptional regulator